MAATKPHHFGRVDDEEDFFEFYWNLTHPECRLESITHTEYGPRREPLAVLPLAVWQNLSTRVVRELAAGMEKAERTRKAPTLKPGLNRLGPLPGRELAVLLWALMEEGAAQRAEAILHGWRELAREERWWLFSKAAMTGERSGRGWRRALFHALSRDSDSRYAIAAGIPDMSMPPPPVKEAPDQAPSDEVSLADVTPAAASGKQTVPVPPKSKSVPKLPPKPRQPSLF